jgi:predicted RNA-binding Zn-ribbon protein involved in translation (DUF1610 family)
MSKFTKIDCPVCGETLIRLNAFEEDEEIINEYWCDECDIDITIRTDKYTDKDLIIENA